MWEMSADMVVSPCAPWSVTEFAQGTAFIGKQTLVPTQAFPVQGAMQFSKTVQRCVCVCVCVCMRVRAHVCQQLSHVQLCATPWTIVHQDLLSMEFSRQEYWVAIPFSRGSSLEIFPTQGSSQPKDQIWVSCIAGITKIIALSNMIMNVPYSQTRKKGNN